MCLGVLGEEFWRIGVLEIEVGVKGDRVWILLNEVFFEVVEEGVEGEKGRRPFTQSRLKAGGVEAALKRPSLKAGGL